MVVRRWVLAVDGGDLLVLVDEFLPRRGGRLLRRILGLHRLRLMLRSASLREREGEKGGVGKWGRCPARWEVKEKVDCERQTSGECGCS